jgi:hypothetical protein
MAWNRVQDGSESQWRNRRMEQDGEIGESGSALPEPAELKT